MKVSFVTLSLLTCLALPGLAQTNSVNKSATARPTPSANPAKASAATAPPAATDVSASRDAKPGIAELMKGNTLTNSVGMVMVKISRTLWAGRYDVTQEEYQKVMGSNPSQFRGARNPVDSVSWDDARTFCAKLNEMERKEEMLPEGFSYSLPTQAQWESLIGSATADDTVNSLGGARSGPAPVGSLAPNNLGLYDIRGNMWQWCLDPEDKPYRVLRGGAWDTFVEINLRPEFRWYSNGPDDKKNSFSFRCVLEPVG